MCTDSHRPHVLGIMGNFLFLYYIKFMEQLLEENTSVLLTQLVHLVQVFPLRIIEILSYLLYLCVYICFHVYECVYPYTCMSMFIYTYTMYIYIYMTIFIYCSIYIFCLNNWG